MQKREIAVEIALENVQLKRSLNELANAAFVIYEYVDNFGRFPPSGTEIAKDFHNALWAAKVLLGGEMADAGCL